MAASKIPLIGYSDRLSVRPGDTIAFKVSCTSPEPYDAKLVRITCGDPNPAGPGIKEKDVPADFTGQYPSRAQNINLGSYAKVAPGSALDGVDQLTFAATIWPTRLKNFDQGVLCRFNSDSGQGCCAPRRPAGCRSVGRSSGRRAASRFDRHAAPGAQLVSHLGERQLRVQNRQRRSVRAEQAGYREGNGKCQARRSFGVRYRCANHDRRHRGKPVEGHYNGKIEAPKVYKAAIDPTQSEDGMASHWDFAQEISTKRIVDVGPLGLHGEVYNAPARAMKGSNWTGAEMRWKYAPETYAAIHFHEDDIEDCEWETDFSFTVPEGPQTGLYGARLRSAENCGSPALRRLSAKGRTDSRCMCAHSDLHLYDLRQPGAPRLWRRMAPPRRRLGCFSPQPD